MTRHRKSEKYWPSESFGASKRWNWKTIPLSEITSYGRRAQQDRPKVRTLSAPSQGPVVSTLVEDLERLDSVVHNFLACLNPSDLPVPIDKAGSADIERFVRILEYAPPTGGPVLGPPVLCGMSPPVELESLFGFLGSLHKTGILRIHTSDTIFMISIVEGDVVHGVSNRRPEAELLGNILVSLGSVDRDSLEKFFRECGSSACMIGEALNREELVATRELRRALEIQLRKLFDRLLAPGNAEWCFHEGEATLSYINLRVNAIGVLLDSARVRDEGNSG